MTTSSRSAALQEWKSGWPVVLAGLFGTAMCGLAYMPLGAFMAPLESAFGWSRSEFSIGISICSSMGVLLPPFVGMLIDRYGPRAVAVTGALASGAIYSLFSTITGSFVNWVMLWTIYGVAIALMMFGLWSTAVATAFSAGRGLAMAIALSGSALVGVVAPAVANWLIEQYGFRSAFVFLGIIPGLVVALVCWFALPRPQRRGSLASTSDEKTAASPAEISGFSLREAMTSVVFVKLIILAVIINTALLALPLHLISILGASGVDRDAAVKIAGLFAAAAIAGKFLSGVVLDAIPAKLVLALFTVMLGISLSLFTVTDPGIGLSIFATLLGGFCFGGVSPIFPYLGSRHFGLKSFGRLSGIIFSALAFGAIVGPMLAAFVFDLTQSYVPFLLGSLPGLGLAVVLCLTLGRYPQFATAPD
jgi:MFS family permease